MTMQINRRGGLLSVTLDRPERGNALSASLVEELIAAVDEAFADASVHTLVLGGAGRNFCTGFDLTDFEQCSDGDLLLRFARIEQLLSMLWHAPIRTACLAGGRTWGAGADLLVACDERIAVEGASFRFPGPAFGIVLGTRRLTERIGVDGARNVLTRGLELDAPAALAAGLVNETCAADHVQARLEALATAPIPDRDTLRRLREATRPDRRDADLAALVRSAARPGLKARLLAYRDAQRATRR
jgi:enoyl-CoA hydratase/carnithine racemase